MMSKNCGKGWGFVEIKRAHRALCTQIQLRTPFHALADAG